jgi:hypothetical protein
MPATAAVEAVAQENGGPFSRDTVLFEVEDGLTTVVAPINRAVAQCWPGSLVE